MTSALLAREPAGDVGNRHSTTCEEEILVSSVVKKQKQDTQRTYRHGVGDDPNATTRYTDVAWIIGHK